MTARISTRTPSLLPSVRYWFANVLARWTERIDSAPMPPHHRMGSWERSVRSSPHE